MASTWYLQCVQAIRKKDIIKLQVYLPNVEDINFGDVNCTLLWVSLYTSQRNIDVFEAILNFEPDLTITNDFNQTPLIYCCESNLADFALLLLIQGCNPNVQDNAGYTPLHYAVFNRNKSLYNLLLQYGAKPTIKDNEGYDVFSFFLLGNKSQFAVDSDYTFCSLFTDMIIREKHVQIAERFDRMSIVNGILARQIKDVNFGVQKL